MIKTVNCIILDDEPPAVKLLDAYAQKIPTLNVLYSGCDAYKAIEQLKNQPVDLMFLDIQMPELTGIELMELFNKEHNFIITSAYQEYALDAYKFHVVDFLLKPISFNRFYQGVEKFINWRQTFHDNPATPAVDHLFVKAGRKHHKISIASILYIEGLKDYIRIHTDDEKIVVFENMKDIPGKLPPHQFIRIHRSYIIAVNKVKVIEGNQVLLQNLEYIPIGETYRKTVAAWVGEK